MKLKQRKYIPDVIFKTGIQIFEQPDPELDSWFYFLCGIRIETIPICFFQKRMWRFF
jgi:hypothetical protein